MRGQKERGVNEGGGYRQRERGERQRGEKGVGGKRGWVVEEAEKRSK